MEGALFYPAVLTNVPLHARVAIEEQFGPVIPIREFDDLQEVKDYVINSPYGNQASLFGQGSEQMGTMIDFLSNQVCRININAQCQRGPDVSLRAPGAGSLGREAACSNVWRAIAESVSARRTLPMSRGAISGATDGASAGCAVVGAPR